MLLPIAYMLGILAVCLTPSAGRSSLLPSALIAWLPWLVQNALHVPAFAGLACLWSWSLSPRLPAPRGPVTYASVISGCFGIVTEWIQAGVPGRESSISDAALNLVGVALGAFLFAVARNRS